MSSRIRLLRFFWLFVSPTALCSLASLLLYLVFRVKCLVSAHTAFKRNEMEAQADGPQSLALAWLFLGFEILSLRKILRTLRALGRIALIGKSSSEHTAVCFENCSYSSAEETDPKSDWRRCAFCGCFDHVLQGGFGSHSGYSTCSVYDRLSAFSFSDLCLR